MNGLNSFGAGCQHNETVEAKRSAACFRHIGESGEEILINGTGDAENTLLFLHVIGESSTLFIWISQFVESIDEFNAATIQFETFGNARIIVGHPSERGLACWVGMKYSGPPKT